MVKIILCRFLFFFWNHNMRHIFIVPILVKCLFLFYHSTLYHSYSCSISQSSSFLVLFFNVAHFFSCIVLVWWVLMQPYAFRSAHWHLRLLNMLYLRYFKRKPFFSSIRQSLDNPVHYASLFTLTSELQSKIL